MSHSIKLKFLGDFEDFPSAKGRGGEGQSQLFPFAVNDSDHRHHRNQITQEILLSKEDLDVCLPDSALPVNWVKWWNLWFDVSLQLECRLFDSRTPGGPSMHREQQVFFGSNFDPTENDATGVKRSQGESRGWRGLPGSRRAFEKIC